MKLPYLEADGSWSNRAMKATTPSTATNEQMQFMADVFATGEAYYIATGLPYETEPQSLHEGAQMFRAKLLDPSVLAPFVKMMSPILNNYLIVSPTSDTYDRFEHYFALEFSFMMSLAVRGIISGQLLEESRESSRSSFSTKIIQEATKKYYYSTFTHKDKVTYSDLASNPLQSFPVKIFTHRQRHGKQSGSDTILFQRPHSNEFVCYEICTFVRVLFAVIFASGWRHSIKSVTEIPPLVIQVLLVSGGEAGFRRFLTSCKALILPEDCDVISERLAYIDDCADYADYTDVLPFLQFQRNLRIPRQLVSSVGQQARDVFVGLCTKGQLFSEVAHDQEKLMTCYSVWMYAVIVSNFGSSEHITVDAAWEHFCLRFIKAKLPPESAVNVHPAAKRYLSGSNKSVRTRQVESIELLTVICHAIMELQDETLAEQTRTLYSDLINRLILNGPGVVPAYQFVRLHLSEILDMAVPEGPGGIYAMWYVRDVTIVRSPVAVQNAIAGLLMDGLFMAAARADKLMREATARGKKDQVMVVRFDNVSFPGMVLRSLFTVLQHMTPLERQDVIVCKASHECLFIITKEPLFNRLSLCLRLAASAKSFGVHTATRHKDTGNMRKHTNPVPDMVRAVAHNNRIERHFALSALGSMLCRGFKDSQMLAPNDVRSPVYEGIASILRIMDCDSLESTYIDLAERGLSPDAGMVSEYRSGSLQIDFRSQSTVAALYSFIALKLPHYCRNDLVLRLVEITRPGTTLRHLAVGDSQYYELFQFLHETVEKARVTFTEDGMVQGMWDADFRRWFTNTQANGYLPPDALMPATKLSDVLFEDVTHDFHIDLYNILREPDVPKEIRHHIFLSVFACAESSVAKPDTVYPDISLLQGYTKRHAQVSRSFVVPTGSEPAFDIDPYAGMTDHDMSACIWPHKLEHAEARDAYTTNTSRNTIFKASDAGSVAPHIYHHGTRDTVEIASENFEETHPENWETGRRALNLFSVLYNLSSRLPIEKNNKGRGKKNALKLYTDRFRSRDNDVETPTHWHHEHLFNWSPEAQHRTTPQPPLASILVPGDYHVVQDDRMTSDNSIWMMEECNNVKNLGRLKSTLNMYYNPLNFPVVGMSSAMMRSKPLNAQQLDVVNKHLSGQSEIDTTPFELPADDMECDIVDYGSDPEDEEEEVEVIIYDFEGDDDEEEEEVAWERQDDPMDEDQGGDEEEEGEEWDDLEFEEEDDGVAKVGEKRKNLEEGAGGAEQDDATQKPVPELPPPATKKQRPHDGPVCTFCGDADPPQPHTPSETGSETRAQGLINTSNAVVSNAMIHNKAFKTGVAHMICLADLTRGEIKERYPDLAPFVSNIVPKAYMNVESLASPLTNASSGSPIIGRDGHVYEATPPDSAVVYSVTQKDCIGWQPTSTDPFGIVSNTNRVQKHHSDYERKQIIKKMTSYPKANIRVPSWEHALVAKDGFDSDDESWGGWQ